ncbi:MAG: GNAT family N-acetyltransferase, partial [Sphingobium sp.]
MLLNDRLETSQLIIRPFTPEDAEPLVALFADPRVHRHVDDGQPLGEEMARLWVVRSGENLVRHGYGTGAVVLRETGKLIGWAGFARPGDGSKELIYGLAPAHWRRGLGTELLDALIAFGRTRRIDPLRATVAPANTGSVRLLEKAGFTLTERGYD